MGTQTMLDSLFFAGLEHDRIFAGALELTQPDHCSWREIWNHTAIGWDLSGYRQSKGMLWLIQSDPIAFLEK